MATPRVKSSCASIEGLSFWSIVKYWDAMICRSLRSSWRSLSTRFSIISESFFITGKTSMTRVSTWSALRTSMYSLDSRHVIIDLDTLQYLAREVIGGH